MSETYILKIDQLCKSCGMRNKIEKVTDFKVEIVACGECGTFIIIPEGISEEEKKLIQDTIDKAIEGEF